MRLIDADEAIKHIKNFIRVYKYYHPNSPDPKTMPINEAIGRIEDVPTVEVEPVPRGRWEEYIDQKSGAQMATCTVCGKNTLYGVTYSLEGIRHAMHYCPNCGAKMEG